MFKRAWLLAAVLAALVVSVQADQVPELIAFQGYLEDGAGNPINDTVNLTFTVYDASTSGNSKWTETQYSVEILGGLFGVTLGSSTAVPDTVFNDDGRWLGIRINAGTELSPRTRLVSSAYAHRVNTVDGATGGTIDGDVSAGKGDFGTGNTNSGSWAFTAGDGNTASGSRSSVAGGHDNTASANFTHIGGGEDNSVTYQYGTIGGGTGNTVSTSSYATVAGGKDNTSSGPSAAIGGGFANEATDYYAVVAGGAYCEATDVSAFVGGGWYNEATGNSSCVPGGLINHAHGDRSFAAGNRGRANHTGSFVLSANAASSDTDTIASGGNSQMVLRADGGMYITNTGGLAPYNTARLINTSSGAYLTTGGTWTNSSDRSLKENFSNVNTAEILEKLMTVPISQWNYKAEDVSARHIGPTAQDFHAAFGLGDDDKTISTVDPAGVAMAAIQELYRMQLVLEAKTAEIDRLSADFAAFRTAVEARIGDLGQTTYGQSESPATTSSGTGSAGGK